jgi:hypothetical protein
MSTIMIIFTYNKLKHAHYEDFYQIEHSKLYHYSIIIYRRLFASNRIYPKLHKLRRSNFRNGSIRILYGSYYDVIRYIGNK